MSEKWATQHWCKYCKKFVANNKPSIAIHENGRSHKDEVERFLRGVYKKGRQDIEEKESVRREIQRIEKAALQSMGYIAPSVSAPSTRKAVDYHVQPNIPTLEELRSQHTAQMEPVVEGNEAWAIKKEISQVGEWEIVEVKPPVVTEKKQKEESRDTHSLQLEDDDEDEENLSGYKLKEKEYPTDTVIEEETDEVKPLFKKRKMKETSEKKFRKKTLRKKE